MSDDTSLQAAERAARLRQIVSASVESIVRDVHALVRERHNDWPETPADQLISLAQLNGLRNAAAWHEDRPRAYDRLKRLDQELDRLIERSDGDLKTLYGSLKQLIVATTVEGEPAPRWRNIAERLEATGEQQKEVRLAMALMTIDTLIAIYRTRGAQLAMKQKRGLEWP